MHYNEILKSLEAMHQWDALGITPASDTDAYVTDILQRVAPEAERLGYSQEQHELEELAIKLGYPEDYQRLKKLLLESEMMCEMVFRTFATPICAMLDEMGLEYTFKYRMKSVYSVWRKVRLEGKEFDDVYDLFGTRIVYKADQPLGPLPFTEDNVLDKEPEVAAAKSQQLSGINVENMICWRIYTVISMLYRIHPDRIRNWITHPKPSGYQALQMTVMGPDCNWIEIQVRSDRMDYEAEQGMAAHWKYKQEPIKSLKV